MERQREREGQKGGGLMERDGPSAIVVSGVPRKCSEREAVVGFMMGVQSACDAPQFYRKCSEPKTLGKCHHGGAQSLRGSANTRDWSAQNMLRARCNQCTTRL